MVGYIWWQTRTKIFIHFNAFIYFLYFSLNNFLSFQQTSCNFKVVNISSSSPPFSSWELGLKVEEQAKSVLYPQSTRLFRSRKWKRMGRRSWCGTKSLIHLIVDEIGKRNFTLNTEKKDAMKENELKTKPIKHERLRILNFCLKRGACVYFLSPFLPPKATL